MYPSGVLPTWLTRLNVSESTQIRLQYMLNMFFIIYLKFDIKQASTSYSTISFWHVIFWTWCKKKSTKTLENFNASCWLLLTFGFRLCCCCKSSFLYQFNILYTILIFELFWYVGVGSAPHPLWYSNSCHPPKKRNFGTTWARMSNLRIFMSNIV